MSTRRRTTTRRVTRKRTPGTYAMRKTARIEAKKVVSRETESKLWDGRMAQTAQDWDGLAVDMFSNPSAATQITQSVGEGGYLGSKITPVYIQCNYQWIYSDVTNIVTVFIIQTKGLFNPIGLDLTNVLQSTANAQAPLSMTDWSYNDRFRVLARRIHYLNNTDRLNLTGSFRIPRSKLVRTTFADAAGTHESGAIYLCMISDSSDAGPTFGAQWRIHYKDA